MGRTSKYSRVVIKLNLLDGPKYIKREVGISWATFILSVILILVMTVAPLLTLKVVNKNLEKKIDMLNATYRSLQPKERKFRDILKQKEEILKFVDEAYNLVSKQARVSVILDEIRKRLPKGTAIQNGVSISVNDSYVSLSLRLISDSYLDAPQLIDAFSQSPYLYVESAKVVPLGVSSVSTSDGKQWNYSVSLTLGWQKSNVEKAGENK